MQLNEILELAKISGLGSYHLKHDEPTMVTLLNASLRQVYLRVPALTKEHILVLIEGKSFYTYSEDAYKILYAKSDCGNNLPVNSDTEQLSIFDMGNNRLDVPQIVQRVTPSVTLMYHIKPPTVTCENILTLDFLPDDALVSSIISYMAYMAGKNISEANGVGHYQEFQQQIDEVKRLGLYNSYSYSINSRFRESGWV